MPTAREADGFWLHRLVPEHGVINRVVEPASILANRRARRAKTGRLDAQGLLRILAAHAKGSHEVCSVVRVPAIEEEDAKRRHREREHLVQERVRIDNRIAALFTTQGVRKRLVLRSWQKDMEEMRTGDGLNAGFRHSPHGPSMTGETGAILARTRPRVKARGSLALEQRVP